VKRPASPKKPIAALILAGLLVPCCYFNQRYPAGWSPPQKNNNNCWGILGTYKDRGETGGKEPYRASLGALIFPSGQYDAREATSVKIAKLTEESIEISVWNGEKQLYSRSYVQSKKEYKCSPKGIQIFTGT